MKAHPRCQFMMAAALALGASTIAFGQNERDKPRDDRAAQDKTAQQDRSGAHAQLMKGSKIIGKNVQTATGDKLGEISDLAINQKTGHIRYAILSSGGVAGVGNTHHVIAMPALKFSGDTEPGRIDITAERFKDAPTFDPKGWGTINDDKWGEIVYRYYGITQDFKDEAKDEAPNFISAKSAIGMEVDNKQSENLGDIQDLMIELRNHRVAYAVLAFGGQLGVNEKFFAVPWQSLDKQAVRERFVLNVDKAKLKDAPGFDDKRWPTLADLRWEDDTDFNRGGEPDWIYGYRPEPGARDPNDGAAPDRNDDTVKPADWTDYNRNFSSGKLEDVSGIVTKTDTVRPIRGASEELLVLTLRTDAGREMLLHVAPQWYMKQQRDRFKEGDNLRVTGAKATIDGKDVLMVTEIQRGSGEHFIIRQKDGTPYWSAWRDTKK